MLKGKTALITGASRGIGREIAVAFAENGANLFLTYNSTPMDETLKAVGDAGGGETATFKGNVAESGASESAVAECKEKFGGVDILINNAGITRDGLLMRMKDDDWDAVLNTNLKGAFSMVRAVSKVMIKKRAGKIINVGSVVGSMGNAGQVNYAASKAGLIGLTKSVARELASRNVQVNLIAPGYIGTDMTDALDDKAKEAIMQGIPAGKLGTPRDVANSALFLASSNSDYITGHVLHVNGGMYM